MKYTFKVKKINDKMNYSIVNKILDSKKMSALTLSFRAKLSLVWQISLASDSFNDVLVMCDSGLIIIYDKNSELLRHKIFYEHKSLIKKRTILSYFLYIAYSAILRRRILLQYLITMFRNRYLYTCSMYICKVNNMFSPWNSLKEILSFLF